MREGNCTIVVGPLPFPPDLSLTGTACKTRYGRYCSRPIMGKGNRKGMCSNFPRKSPQPKQAHDWSVGARRSHWKPRKPEPRWPCDRPCWSPRGFWSLGRIRGISFSRCSMPKILKSDTCTCGKRTYRPQL